MKDLKISVQRVSKFVNNVIDTYIILWKSKSNI